MCDHWFHLTGPRKFDGHMFRSKSEISGHTYSNSYILFKFHTNECFTIIELPRLMWMNTWWTHVWLRQPDCSTEFVKYGWLIDFVVCGWRKGTCATKIHANIPQLIYTQIYRNEYTHKYTAQECVDCTRNTTNSSFARFEVLLRVLKIQQTRLYWRYWKR